MSWLEVIIDGTERPIQRPKNKQRQKHSYSGKKKRHTVKNVMISERRTKKLKALSPTYAAKASDKRIADQAHYCFPAGSRLWKALVFKGYEPEGVETYQPKKKPPKDEQTAVDKARNRVISRVPVRVEHGLGNMNVFHIARDVYRNHRRHSEDLRFETACELHNFRCDYRLSYAA